MNSPNLKLNERMAKTVHSVTAFINILFVMLTWYMLGPFLHSDTWQLLRYRFKSKKAKLSEPKPETTETNI